jgi:hypothetical protein
MSFRKARLMRNAERLDRKKKEALRLAKKLYGSEEE